MGFDCCVPRLEHEDAIKRLEAERDDIKREMLEREEVWADREKIWGTSLQMVDLIRELRGEIKKRKAAARKVAKAMRRRTRTEEFWYNLAVKVRGERDTYEIELAKRKAAARKVAKYARDLFLEASRHAGARFINAHMLEFEIEKRKAAARKVAKYARERKAVAAWQKTGIDVWRLSYENATRKKCELQRRLNDLGYQKQIEPMLDAAIKERDELQRRLDALRDEGQVEPLLDEVIKERDLWKAKHEELWADVAQQGRFRPERKPASKKEAEEVGDGHVLLGGDVKLNPDNVKAAGARAVERAKKMSFSGLKGLRTGRPAMPPVKYTLTDSPGAKLPERKSAGASGYDAFAALSDTAYIGPGTRRLIPLGVALEVPRGYECQIRARSGLAYVRGLTILNGVGTIDSDYRGELKALVINHDTRTAMIDPGQAIAQLVFAPVEAPELVEVDELSATKRGAGGFGSTDEVKQ